MARPGPEDFIMDITGKSFLIVGGASLAGSHIADALLAAGAGRDSEVG